ncbi:23S rRNA pseudouridine(2604) synthase RluF [Marinomonas transparens]|uniref:Pseudouridine synthase n=1 Tax=Marinomonas transparens TaxID=2795388 RepID=A0A934JSB9_9GAMM|nr:23S rRNA pseudouridine(2604) synthase RluF [Marinomonas transparens]MBJ7537452.1 23S rRNA pseudouridine(2604) synthase RluF [Marinomonas transparens]
MFNASSTRLNKYISESGICSRRDADRFIEQGNVFINGKRAKIGDQVTAGDTVRVNGQLIEPQDAEDFLFIAVNKPVGIVSTTESSEKDNIVDFVNHSARIFPIGRLDKDSQGLIFLTNNGDLVNKVLRAGNNHEKEYLVTVNKPITDDFISGLAGGVPILGTRTKKCPVSKVAPSVFNITLVQGLNRQIRRMCEYFGYEVVKLERTRIMNVSLKGLPVGEWRDLTEKELTELLKAVEDSSSEAAPNRKSQNTSRNTGRDSGTKQTTGARKSTGTSRGNTKQPSGKGADDRRSNGKRPTGKKPFADGKKPTGSSKPAGASKGNGKRPSGETRKPTGTSKGGATKGRPASKGASKSQGKPQSSGKRPQKSPKR